MTRIIKSMFVIVVVAAMATGATRVVFSDQKTIAGNTFATGTLTIDEGHGALKPWVISGAYPGYSTAFEWASITNTGTLGGNLTTSAVNTGGNALLYGVLKIEVQMPSGTTVYDGLLSALNVPAQFLGAGATATFWQRIYLDSDLPDDDNDYQGLSTTFDEVFNITQPY